MEDFRRKMKPCLCISILSIALMQHGSALWLRIAAPPADGHAAQHPAWQTRSTVYCGSKAETKKAEQGLFLHVNKGLFLEVT